MCTGYVHHFPFLPESLTLRTSGNHFWSPGLYKGVVWNENPDLFYLGMQRQNFSMTMFDTEAWFARDVILGRIRLPSKEERTIDMRKWKSLYEEA